MKRYKTPEEIEQLIDRFIREKEQLRLLAADNDHLADCLRTTIECGRIRKIRDGAEEMRAQSRWRETRVNNLKEKLAEIRTKELPGMETDGSVQSS